ncbi:MAG: hypothetical protein N3D75_00880 [Candidatus Aenigmarchaeota archaeon]|nr:hypothetical protein [Candidatus Aenigmarchaeota archaeon]
MTDKIMRQIRAELVRDKRFRNELSVALINDILSSDDMGISQSQVNKKIIKIIDELIRIKFDKKEDLLYN